MDEAFNGIDLITAREIMENIVRLNPAAAIVIVTPNSDELPFATEVYRFVGGILAKGAPL